MSYQNIQNKIQNAPSLDFGTILDQSIKLFKQIWIKGFLMVLVMMLIGFTLSFALVAIGLIPNPYETKVLEEVSFFSFYAQNAIDNMLQTIIVSPLVLGMLAGFYRTCKQEDLKESVDDDLFHFFKGEHIRKVLMLGLIYAVIVSVAQALFVLPYIYAFVPLSFFSVVYANNPDLTEAEIVKLSFSLGNKKWLLTFGLIFITAILGMLGIIACGIGVLFTISIVYLPVYFVYRDVVGFEDHDEIRYIGSE